MAAKRSRNVVHGLAAAIGVARPNPRALFAPMTALALLWSAAAHANNYTVTANGDPGTGGLSLRQAIALANASAGSVIDFDASLVGSTITLTQGQIAITAPMSIVGPGADKISVSGNDASRIFYVDTEVIDSAVTISGLTLTHANPEADGKFHFGGAIYDLNSYVVVQNSALTHNAAGAGPAAVVFSGFKAAGGRFDNDTITDNTSLVVYNGAVAFGGLGGAANVSISNSTVSSNKGCGIYGGVNGQLTLTSSVVEYNTGSTKGGGGVHIKYGGLTASNVTVAHNSTLTDGGGISVAGATAIISNSTIAYNYASGNGGGIVFSDAPGIAPRGALTLTASSVTDNAAYDVGAGIDVARAASVSIQRSLVTHNHATDFSSAAKGGGLAIEYVTGTTSVSNSTFYRNFAYESGGGIGIFNATSANNTTIANATIVLNSTAYFYGNGIFSLGQPYILSSIVARNSSRMNSQDLSGTFHIKYSLIETPGDATLNGIDNITGVDPGLGKLTDNGGPTLSMLPAATAPVLNDGKPSVSSGVDQRGLPRVVGGRVDMGAVERQNPEDLIFRDGFDSS